METAGGPVHFDEEWATAKAQARAEEEASATSTRLNGPGPIPPSTGGFGDADLKVSQKELAAVGGVAEKLYHRLKRDADEARPETQTAAGSLHRDFALGSALDHVASRWIDQTRTVLDALGHISSHLDYSKKAHRSDDERTQR